MENINTTKMSSRGQIVIPLEMRKGLKDGEEFVIIKNGKQIILKKITDFSENLKEDLEFAKRTEEALKRIDKGEFISVDSENLFEEMNKW